eukprot:scaffold277228_cov36-Tisochrysis_lutea.AAC.1
MLYYYSRKFVRCLWIASSPPVRSDASADVTTPHMLAATSALSLAVAALSRPGVALQRTLSLSFAAHQEWLDATRLIADVLPAFPSAVAHLETGGEEKMGVALLDPRLLSFGSVNAIAPGASTQRRLALALERGELLLPADVCVLVVRQDNLKSTTTCELSLEVELASELALSAGALSAHSQRARAAIHACLAESGLAPDEIALLEAIDQLGGRSPAKNVYEAFVRADPPPLERPKKTRGRAGAVPRATRNSGDANGLVATAEDRDGAERLHVESGQALMARAQRAAHHVIHLLKAERVASAVWFRNTDVVERPSGIDGSNDVRVPVTLILDNVRSAYNVGSIFRTADTACLAEVVTCGFTPHPPHPKLEKTGFGAITAVPSRHFGSTLAALAVLRSEGIEHIAAMETTERSENYVAANYPSKGVALILGNEEVGVDTSVLEQCDDIIEIPTLGTKNSLNVASAASVVVFEVLRQWGHLHR